MSTNNLFSPFNLKTLNLKNRIVMAPMTRSFSPNGIPTDEVASYYQKRAEGEVGLILSEGTVIDRTSSSNDANIPHFYGDQALKGWKKVIDDVHAAGVRWDHKSGIWELWIIIIRVGFPVPFEGPSD